MPDKELKPRTLLFVEDEQDIIDLYKIAFEAEGFIVEGILTGKGVLKRLNEFSADGISGLCAIILDILLPDISGADIMREIRGQSKFDKVLIIVFTNYSSDEIKKEINAAKNANYILKMNTSPQQLVAIVKKMLEDADKS